MSKPLPDPAEHVRAIADEMCARLNAILTRSQAARESGRFVVLATHLNLPVMAATTAYGPYDRAEATTVAEALRTQFAAIGEGDAVVRVVPWAEFYQ